MKYIYIIPILFFAAGIIQFSSCQKELSCEGPECRGIYDDGKALYTFLQSNGLCGNTLLKGIYKEGVNLTDSNTVSLKLTITKKGNYNISTDTINGFYFSAKGAFTDTGAMSVLLKGTGKPVSDGVFTFTSNPVSGCNFNVKVDTVPYVELYFYEFTLDGIRYTDTVRGGVRISNSEDTNSQKGMWSAIGYGREIITQTGWLTDDGIVIGKHSIPSSLLNLTGLQNYFAAGNYNYLARYSSANGVLVGWLDLSDPAYYWVSSIGVQPAASNFTIISVETYADSQGRPIAKVKATFNCILYNGVGQSKELTNGKFYGEFANIER